MPEPTPTGIAGFQTRLRPLDLPQALSRRSWNTDYSLHPIHLNERCPFELDSVLGAVFATSPWPQVECPPPVPHRAPAVTMLLPGAVAPSELPAAIAGTGLPEPGMLRHLEPSAGTAATISAPATNENWDTPAVEISEAVPGLPETCWESCATIAPKPAERWLSLMFSIEPVRAEAVTQSPLFDLAAETAECFRDVADAPPPLVQRWMPCPAAEAAERWLQPALAANLAAGIPVAAPNFDAAIDGAAPETAEWAQVPPPEAVENWLSPFMAAQLPVPDMAPCLPACLLDIQGAEVFRDPAELPPSISESWAPVPAAEPVETWLRPAAAEAAWTASAVLPEFSSSTAACAPALAEAMASPAAEPAARWIEPAFAADFLVAAHAIEKPAFAIGPQRDQIFRDPADVPPGIADEFAPVPAAEPVARWIDIAFAPVVVSAPAALRIPSIESGELPAALSLAGPVASLAAEVAERWIEPALAAGFLAPEASVQLLPFGIAAETPAVLQDPADVPPAFADTFAPVPAAQPCERWIETATAHELAPAAAATAPAIPLSVVAPFVPFIPRFARPQAAEPAAIFVKPAFSLLPTHPQVTFQPLPHRIGQSIEGPGNAGMAGAAIGPNAVPVESMPAAGKAPIPIRRAPALPAAAATPQPARLAPAGVTEIYPAAARAAAESPATKRVKPVETVVVRPPAARIDRPFPHMPRPELQSLEYYCQRGSGSPSRRLSWATPPIPAAALRFQLKPAFENLEEQVAPKPTRKQPAIAEIFTLPEARQRFGESLNVGWIGKVAAGFMVMFALWSGSKIADFGRQPVNVAHETAAAPHSVDAPPLVARGESRPGVMAKMRQAVANRAALSVGDTFHGSMESWGAGAGKWVSGWSRSADGYMKVGELALFQPTRTFQDYRLEFYGQIEKKSMGWVMRAKDKQNYYAMKFTVVEPGLRPVIAMVHYPVVDGKRGHKVETPLNVMVHNNTPYHVTVDVKGNHFVAAIEGEQVDEWTDDTPGQGAVGFFSEAGEAARLYWAKVSKNQDWIGRFCSYLSGDEASRTAELWNPGPAPEAPAPTDPRPRDYVVVAAHELRLEEEDLTPRGASIAKNWRNPLWIS